MANTEQYRAVLDDLMKQRSQLQFRIGEIDTALMALRRIMPDQITVEPNRIDAKMVQPPLPIDGGRYAGMSNRWAILALLTEDATGPMTTGQIAEALRSGGMVTHGQNYAGNVSAVLSGMNRTKGEVVPSADGWVISEVGKEAWIHIKTARERRGRLNSVASPNEQQKPSLQ